MSEKQCEICGDYFSTLVEVQMCGACYENIEDTTVHELIAKKDAEIEKLRERLAEATDLLNVFASAKRLDPLPGDAALLIYDFSGRARQLRIEGCKNQYPSLHSAHLQRALSLITRWYQEDNAARWQKEADHDCYVQDNSYPD